ncbi:hypothetical protein [Pseudoroseicyclus tamaricis]|uniref:Uncharacterized protein n=1 Tax=Pseudoroseicyclus tamaricis TaxID=2705421 RepID=A0A6B2JQ87_9RHOB|nr:hypothetical protein [Pseudoroseicyclus tamaricis]NDV00847.1 hypothetical protein [Pseudoroseicyclus tamaricis]
MPNDVIYDAAREAHVIRGEDVGERYRIVIPDALIDAEAGEPVGDRLAWIEAHLPQILQAYTAKMNGGFVHEPWGRVLVEEVD